MSSIRSRNLVELLRERLQLEVPGHIKGVIRLRSIEATGENVSIFNVEAFEELSVALVVCKLLRVVEGSGHLEKAAIVEHDVPLTFHARHCRDIHEFLWVNLCVTRGGTGVQSFDGGAEGLPVACVESVEGLPKVAFGGRMYSKTVRLSGHR